MANEVRPGSAALTARIYPSAYPESQHTALHEVRREVIPVGRARLPVRANARPNQRGDEDVQAAEKSQGARVLECRGVCQHEERRRDELRGSQAEAVPQALKQEAAEEKGPASRRGMGSASRRPLLTASRRGESTARPAQGLKDAPRSKASGERTATSSG